MSDVTVCGDVYRVQARLCGGLYRPYWYDPVRLAWVVAGPPYRTIEAALWAARDRVMACHASRVLAAACARLQGFS